MLLSFSLPPRTPFVSLIHCSAFRRFAREPLARYYRQIPPSSERISTFAASRVLFMPRSRLYAGLIKRPNERGNLLNLLSKTKKNKKQLVIYLICGLHNATVVYIWTTVLSLSRETAPSCGRHTREIELSRFSRRAHFRKSIDREPLSPFSSIARARARKSPLYNPLRVCASRRAELASTSSF